MEPKNHYVLSTVSDGEVQQLQPGQFCEGSTSNLNHSPQFNHADGLRKNQKIKAEMNKWNPQKTLFMKKQNSLILKVEKKEAEIQIYVKDKEKSDQFEGKLDKDILKANIGELLNIEDIMHLFEKEYFYEINLNQGFFKLRIQYSLHQSKKKENIILIPLERVKTMEEKILMSELQKVNLEYSRLKENYKKSQTTVIELNKKKKESMSKSLQLNQILQKEKQLTKVFIFTTVALIAFILISNKYSSNISTVSDDDFELKMQKFEAQVQIFRNYFTKNKKAYSPIQWEWKNLRGYRNKGKYYGMLQDGIPHGKGKFICANDDILYGEWEDGKLHGKVVLQLKDGGKEYQQWNNGIMHGYVINYGKDRISKYEFNQGYAFGEKRDYTLKGVLYYKGTYL